MTPRTPSELLALLAEGTGGEWKARRSFEGFDGPYYDIDPEDEATYSCYPFVGIAAPGDEVVVNAHDCFEFRPGDAEKIVALHNLAPRLAALWEAAEGEKEARMDCRTSFPEKEAAILALDRALADLRGGA